MLVLSRKVEEVVRIGDSVTVKILEIMGDKVVLGFEAPKDVSIHRQEVYDRIQMEGEKRHGGSIPEMDEGRVRGGQESCAVFGLETDGEDATGSASVLP